MDFIKFLETGELSDICVVVEGNEFHLHKFPLFAKSEFFRALARNKFSEERNGKLTLADFPGGPDIFQLVANHCYNVPIDISESNVCALRCAAEYLQMSEQNEGDGRSNFNSSSRPASLATVTDRYISDVITSGRASRTIQKITNLIGCCRKLGVRAEQVHIVEKCIAAIVDTWLVGYRYLRWDPTEPVSTDIENLHRLHQFPVHWFSNLIFAARRGHVTDDVIAIMIQIYIRQAMTSQLQQQHQQQQPMVVRRGTPAGQSRDETGVNDDESDSTDSDEHLQRRCETVTDDELVTIIDSLLPLIPRDQSSRSRSVAPQWLLSTMERARALPCSKQSNEILNKLAGECLNKFSAADLGRLSPESFIDIAKVALNEEHANNHGSTSDDDGNDDDAGENNNNNLLEKKSSEKEDSSETDKNDNEERKKENNENILKNNSAITSEHPISRQAFNRNTLRRKKREDTPGQSHSEQESSNEDLSSPSGIKNTTKNPRNKKEEPINKSRQVADVCSAAETYLKILHDEGRLDPATFRKVAAAVPDGLRINEDTLFSVIDGLLKSDMKEDERQAMLESIDYDNLGEKSLLKALDSNLLPEATVARAALALCDKLRAELERKTSGSNSGADFYHRQLGQGYDRIRSWRPTSAAHVTRVASFNSEAESTDSNCYSTEQEDSTLPRRVNFYIPPRNVSQRYHGCFNRTGPATTNYTTSRIGTGTGSVYRSTSKPTRTVPSLASEVELRLALDSLKTANEVDYSGLVGGPGRNIGGWRNAEPSRPVSIRGAYPPNDRCGSAASELNKFYDDLEHALYLDSPRNESSYSLGQYNTQPRYF